MRVGPWQALGAVLLLLFGRPETGGAQEPALPTGRIAGQVVDAESGRPVAGARILVEGTGASITSDLDGRFRTPAVPVGPQSIRVAAIGFRQAILGNVMVKAGEAVTANVALTAAVVELQELAVEAQAPVATSSSAGLLAIQKASPTVIDGISSEQIANSADGDASESAARIPGVSVVQDKVVVRGLGERYSTTSLNGSELPSPDPAKKVVPLDIFPSGLLDAVITTKTATPDRPGDFTGGSVDIRTKEFPEQRVLSLSMSGGFNSLATFEQLSLPPLTGSAWLATADAERSLPPIPVPPLRGEASDPETIRFFQGVRNVYTPDARTAPPEFSLGATYGDQLASGALGWIIAGNYGLGYDGQAERLFRFIRTPDLVAEPQGAAGAVFTEASQAVDLSGILNLNARIGDHTKLGFKNLFTRNARDLVYSSDGFNVESAANGNRIYQVRYTSRSLRQHQLSGDHILGFFRGSRLEWRATYAQAREDEPDNRNLQYLVGPLPEDPNTSTLATAVGRPNTWFSTGLTDDFLTGQLDLSIPFQLRRPDDLIVKVGGYYRARNRDFRNLVFVAELDRSSTFEFRQLPPEQQMAPENIGTLVIANRSDGSGLDYFMNETIPAAYGMLDVEALPGVRFTGGLRYEVWEFALDFVEDGEGPPSDPRFAPIARTNKDLLWSGNVTWELSDRVNLHLAAFRSVARPDGRELSPNFFAPIAGECSQIGNAALQRTSVVNGDARLEFYPSAGEVLSVAGFYKQFAEPIVELVQTEVGGGANCQIIPSNAESARNFGIELNAHKRLLTRSDGSGFDVSANYTYVSSQANLGPLYEEQGFRPPLVLQSPHLVNASLGWSSEGGLLTANVLVNYFSDRIIRYGLITPTVDGLEIIPDVVEQGRVMLDAKMILAPWPGVRFALTGQNLTNQNLVYTQRTVEGEVPVARAQLGLRISLGASYAF